MKLLFQWWQRSSNFFRAGYCGVVQTYRLVCALADARTLPRKKKQLELSSHITHPEPGTLICGWNKSFIVHFWYIRVNREWERRWRHFGVLIKSYLIWELQMLLWLKVFAGSALFIHNIEITFSNHLFQSTFALYYLKVYLSFSLL